MPRHRLRRGLPLLALLVSCSSNEPVPAPVPPTTSSTTAPTTAPTASPTVTALAVTPAPAATGCSVPVPTAVPFPATTAPDTATPVGGPLGLQSATAGPQPGYDRVVFTLAGSAGGQPGWDVKYVSAPTSDGSGNAVAVAGTAFLEVAIKDVGYPGDTGVADPAVKQLDPSCTKVVKQVVLDTVFEGRYTAFIGLTATRPFRVFRLANPARVVVDVRHS